MRKISDDKLNELRSSGRIRDIVRNRVEKEPESKPDTGIAKSMEELVKHVETLASKPDTSKMVMESIKSITEMLLMTVDKLKLIQPETSTKEWDVKVQRGSDKMISSIRMRAV